MCPPGSGKYSLLFLALLGWLCSVYGVITYRPINGVWLLFLIISLTGLGGLVYFLSQLREGRGREITFGPSRGILRDLPSPRQWDKPDPDDFDDAA